MKLKHFFLSLVVTMFLMVACDSSPKVPSDPAGTFNKVISDLGNYNPSTLWAALPKSYQADVKRLISTYSEMMDAETYNKFSALSIRVAKLLKNKKELFLPMVKQMLAGKGIPDDAISNAYDSVVFIVLQIYTSDLGQHAKLKDFDVGKFLSKRGAKILAKIVGIHPFIKVQYDQVFKTVSAKQVSVNGDEAKLLVKNARGREREQIFVRVEGRWIPKKMQVGWKAMITEAEQKLAAQKAQMAQTSAQMKAMIPVVESVVTQLEKAKSAEDLGILQKYLPPGVVPK